MPRFTNSLRKSRTRTGAGNRANRSDDSASWPVKEYRSEVQQQPLFLGAGVGVGADAAARRFPAGPASSQTRSRRSAGMLVMRLPTHLRSVALFRFAERSDTPGST